MKSTFFTQRQVNIAESQPRRVLKRGYRRTEKDLKAAARAGASERELHLLMCKHQLYEYALLAQERMQHKKTKRGRKS